MSLGNLAWSDHLIARSSACANALWSSLLAMGSFAHHPSTPSPSGAPTWLPLVCQERGSAGTTDQVRFTPAGTALRAPIEAGESWAVRMAMRNRFNWTTEGSERERFERSAAAER